MPVRNQNWYNLQASRRYPLDDKSTGVDDAGAFIREDIIVDCHIRFPETLGQYLYVQGITVSPNLVTVVFGAADSLTDTNNNTTIAAVSISKPVATNVNYAIEALHEGVSGWVVFGAGVSTDFSGRYSTPEQTYIGLRNARPYRPLPVPTIGKIDLRTSLSGLVRMTAAPPVTATYIDETLLPSDQRLPKYDPQTQTTNYEPIRAILFATEAPSIVFNPLTYFLGPCGQRPESGTCPKTPIERINGVQPDCVNGNINITVGSGLSVRTFAECGGADITTPRSLEESCARPPKTDRPTDKCPCDPNYTKTDYYCWPPFDPRDVVCEENSEPCPALPICVSFSPCHEPLFEVVSGSFNVASYSAPPVCCPPATGFTVHDTYLATSRGTLNIALYRGCASDWAYNHTISVEVHPAGGGYRQNGGVVVNYMRVTENGRCKTKYIAAIIDVASNALQIYRYNGTSLIKESQLDVTVDQTHWYRISVTAAGLGTTTAITASLYDITDEQQVATLVTNVADYEAVDGRAGLFTSNSIAYFNKFQVS